MSEVGQRPRVRLLSQFGTPVRGVSPYSDQLLDALQKQAGADIQTEDYRAPYPRSLHPGGGYPATRRSGLRWYSPLSWRRLATADYDVLHIQHWMQPLACYLWPLAVWAGRAGKRVIVTVHNPLAHEGIAVLNQLEIGFLRAAEALVVHDARAVATLRHRLGRSGPSLRVIPHGVDLPDLVPVGDTDYRQIGLNPSRRYFCLFGNLRGYKGVTSLLEAWSGLAPRWPHWDLVIAGRLWSGGGKRLGRMGAALLGSDRDAMRIQGVLRQKGLSDRVCWREGFQADEDLDALIRVSDFAVFPYERFASQSGAATRAAGRGCPVLVTDVGALPELAIDSNWILPPNDPHALAVALERRFRAFTKPGGAMEWRRAQRRRIEPFAWSVAARDHVTLYRELVDSPEWSQQYSRGTQ